MAGEAHVSSIEVLEDFRAELVVYLEAAGRILDDVRHEVVSTRNWLQTDRQDHWKRLIHRRGKELAQAEAELLTARLSGNPGAIQDRRLIVQRARQAMQEAEEGLNRVRHWLRHYEGEVESRAKVVHQVRHTIGYDMTKAVAFLRESAKILAEYAALSASAPALSPPAASAGPESARGEPGAGGGSAP